MMNYFFEKTISTQIILLSVPLLILVAACDNSIDPLDEELGIYSIYGALDMNSESNFIRVRDLNIPIRVGEMWDFEGTVTMKNLSTSEIHTLTDTLIHIEGVYVWNFESNMKIEPETIYEVSAENHGGDRVSATATTPNYTNVNMLPVFPDCLTRVTIEFAPLTSGEIEAEVGFEWLGQILWLSYTPELELNGGADRTHQVSFILVEMIEERLGERRWCHQLPDDKLYVRYTHYGPDFLESTVSDTLLIPGGAGNFGAYYEGLETFIIDTTNVCYPNC